MKQRGFLERLLPSALPAKATLGILLHLWRYERALKFGYFPILDVGCGLGYGAKLLGKRTVGVDVSCEALKKARSLETDLNVVLYDGRRMPFANCSFHTVTCFEVIEHLPKSDHQGFLDEIWRVLRPNGYLLISTPNRDYLYKAFMRFRGINRNPFHKFEYSLPEFGALVRNQKLADLAEFRTLGFAFPFSTIPGLAPTAGLELHWGRWGQRWCKDIFVVMRKVT